MSILFTGASAYEFGNVQSLSQTLDTFDPDYALGSISRPSRTQHAIANFYKTPEVTEVWAHAKILFSASTPGSGSGEQPVFAFRNINGNVISGISSDWSTAPNAAYLKLSSDLLTTSFTAIHTVVPREVLVDVDLHYFSSGNTRITELYIDGNMVAQHRVTAAWITPAQLVMAGNGGTCFFSEIIVTEGNEPTIAWRVHSKRPDPSLPGLNTFDTGFWGGLSNDNLDVGVVTENNGARITGGFHPYTGPATPMGIRGIAQTGRFIKNGTLLELSGQLRISDVNYDNPDIEYRDGNRVFSFWDENPATEAPFQVGDFAGLQGGFRTVLP